MSYFNLILRNSISEAEDWTLIENPIGRIELDLSLNFRIFLIDNPKSQQILISFENINTNYLNEFKEWSIYIQNLNNDIQDIKCIFGDLTIKWDYLPKPLIDINQNTIVGFYFQKDIHSNVINGVYIGEYVIKPKHDIILQPEILTPIINSTVDKSNIEIISSEFKTEILNDIHLSTDYKITDDLAGTNIIYSEDQSASLTSLTLDLTNELSINTQYYLFIRYYGTQITIPSDWSNPISFTIT